MLSYKFIPSMYFVNRLRSYYKKCCLSVQSEAAINDSVLWDKIIPSKQEDIHLALMTSDEDTLSLLKDMLSHDLYYGVDNTCLSLWGTHKPGDTIDFNDIIMLAGALGACDLYNPAGGAKYALGVKPTDLLTLEDILLRLDKVIGYKAIFPDPFLCEFGVISSRGPVTYRAAQAIYQANKVKSVCKVLKSSRFKVAEIGGGMGRTAYYLYLAGVRDITAIDIPLGIVRQACFLAGSLGEDKIWFFGEPVSDSDQDMAALIKLVPPGFISLSDTVFDVVFNADSFTEMSSSSASTYFDWVKKNAKSFISINHEANDFRVCDFHSDFIRSLYPLREGYLEEIAFFDYRP